MNLKRKLKRELNNLKICCKNKKLYQIDKVFSIYWLGVWVEIIEFIKQGANASITINILSGEYSGKEESKPHIIVKMCETRGNFSPEVKSVEYSICDHTPDIVQIFTDFLNYYIAIETAKHEELKKSFGIE